MDRRPSSAGPVQSQGGKRAAQGETELSNQGSKRSKPSSSISQGNALVQGPVSLNAPSGARQTLNTYICEPRKFNLTTYLTRNEFMNEFKKENAFQRDLYEEEDTEIYAYSEDFEEGEPCPPLLSPEKERRMKYFQTIKKGLGIPEGFVPEITFWDDEGRSTKYDIGFVIEERSLISDYQPNKANNEDVNGATVINYGNNHTDKKERKNCLGWNTLTDDQGYLPIIQKEGITVDRGSADPEILIRDKIVKWKCNSNLTNVHPLDYLTNDLNGTELENEYSKYSKHLQELSGRLKSFKYNSSIYNYRPWFNPDLPLKSFTEEYKTDHTREEDHGWAFNVDFDDLTDTEN